MRRHKFITLIGGAARLGRWQRGDSSRGYQPVVELKFQRRVARLRAVPLRFRNGLNETGYVEGQNVTVEYRWLDGQYDRLPALMTDLVRRHVAVIATPGSNPASLAQNCNHDGPDCLRRWRRPGQAWSGRQPCPAGRQRDRHQLFWPRGRGQATGAAPRTGA